MDSYRPIRKRGSLEPNLPVPQVRHPDALAHKLNPVVIHETGLLQGYARLLNRNRLNIIWFALGGAALALLATVPRAPVYRTYTSLDIQSLNENFMNLRAVDPSGASGTYSAESNLQTSMKLIQSDELMTRVIRSMEANSNVNIPKRDLLSIWTAKLGFWKVAVKSRSELIAETSKSIKVKPVGLTRLIEVECESTDPNVASEFCNTLAKDYVDQDYETRADTAQQTNTWLTKQLADVRKTLEEKETRLLNYARDNKILFNQETDSVNQEKLKQDQMELSRAQADRITKQSANELANSSNPDSLPPVLDSGPLKGYQEKLTDLLRQKADATAALTPNHPKVIHLQAQIDALQASIDKERGNVLGRIRNEYAAAQSRESLLKNGYQQQEQLVASEVAKEGQFNLLRHEVDSERQIYDGLMQHVREAGLLSMMRNSPVRIVDKAKVPGVPFAPSRATSGAVGLLLGSMFGVGLIFWRERTAPKLRAPGDSRGWGSTRELGVIPSSRVDSHLPSRTGLELVTLQNHRSLLAESYRATMNSMMFGSPGGKSASVFVISSPGAGEGKTSLTCNLGIAIMETRKRVILIDGDLRRPRLHDVFQVSNDFGISDILADDMDVQDMPVHLIAQPSNIPGLSVVACGSKGSSNISTLLHAKSLERLLDRLRVECDVILIDTPPLMHMSDARVIGRHSDGMILVFRSGVTTTESAKTVQEILHQDGVRVLGTVLNDFNPSSEGFYSYYKSYYAYRS